MLTRTTNNRVIALVLISSAATMLASTYGMRIGFNLLQALAFVGLYLHSIRQERSLALFSILTFIILAVFAREPIQSTENIRGVLFSLVLVLFSNKSNRIAPALVLTCSWFFYFCLQLLPISLFDELITGALPIATSKTIELMLFELIGISFIELNFPSKKAKNSSLNSLFSYQANFLIFSIAAISLICFAFSKGSIFPNPNIELKNLQNPSTILLLMLLSVLLLVVFLSSKFSKTMENIFAHLELCATPDSSFLALSRSPALPLVEFQDYSKSIRKKSEALTASRKKATEFKVELSTSKRQIHDLNEKLKDLTIMADSINIGLLALTLDGTITYINRQFYEMLNIEMSQAEMLHYESLITSDSVKCELLLKVIEQVMISKKPTKFATDDLSIDIKLWSHQEQQSRKAQTTLGNERLLIFLKKEASANKSEDLDLLV